MTKNRGIEIYESHVSKLKAEKVLSVTVGDGVYMFVEYSPHFLCATIHRFEQIEDMLSAYDVGIAADLNLLIDYSYLEMSGRLKANEVIEIGEIGRSRLTTHAGERLVA